MDEGKLLGQVIGLDGGGVVGQGREVGGGGPALEIRHAFLHQLGHGAVFVLLHSRGQKARLGAVDKCRTAEKQKEKPTASPDKDAERQCPRRTGGCIDELLHQPGDYEVEHSPHQRPGSSQRKRQPVSAIE